MKNSILITMFVFATIGIFSCTKNTIVEPPTPPIDNSRTVTSSWLSLTFAEMLDEFAVPYLQANIHLNGITDVNHSNHFDFLYVKMQEAGQTVYKRVPFANDTENFTVGHSLSNGVLIIRIDNSNGVSQNLDATRFLDWQFRLIMVSTTDYQNIQADWDDYTSVENALASLPVE
jgi:hypothetical protein